MQAWDDFLTRLEKELGRETVRKWVRPMHVRHFDACNIYLEAKDSFHIMWFEEHVRREVQAHLVNANGRKIRVHLTVADTDQPSVPTSSDPSHSRSHSSPPPSLPAPFGLKFDDLDDTCTFDSYLTLTSNELAVKLLSQLNQPGGVDLGSFNPIFLHGPSGTGKSHLLQATARTLRAQGLRVIYSRAATFTEHVISAIRAGEMQLFRDHYRNVDVLLIDDVEVFSRKAATQEELFHTFNTLHIDDRQLILASNSAPGELRYVEPRLVSRFEWGIVLPVDPVPRDQLRQILLSKAKAMKFPLSSEILTYLVETFQTGPSQSIRALEALALRSHLAGDNISDDSPLRLPLAKSYLIDLVEEERRAELTPSRIVDSVASHYGIQSDDIMGKSQKKEFSLPRQIAMYLCRADLALPFTHIGDHFSRDHSTVMTSCKRIEEQVGRGTGEMASTLNAIRKSFATTA